MVKAVVKESTQSVNGTMLSGSMEIGNLTGICSSVCMITGATPGTSSASWARMKVGRMFAITYTTLSSGIL